MQLDEIGNWSEVKLDIVREYAAAYSRILAKQRGLQHLYIDAFAGAGVHLRKATKELVPGSPLNALNVDPPFREYHLIDMDGGKAANLRALVGDRSDVVVHEGNCNEILLTKVFPRVRYEDYRRGLCLLDPYGLHLEWEVIKKAGSMKSIELFINFPIQDINRNVLHRDPKSAVPEQAARLTAFWGDESWREVAYPTDGNLFGLPEKTTNEAFAQAFRRRLKDVAGFAHVPNPLAMRNSTRAIVYYLFFASPKPVAAKIVEDIFDKHGKRG